MKSKEDLIADSICKTASAGWRAAKWAAPIVGKITLKVANRAGNALCKKVDEADFEAACKKVDAVVDFDKVPSLAKMKKTDKAALGIWQIFKIFGG